MNYQWHSTLLNPQLEISWNVSVRIKNETWVRHIFVEFNLQWRVVLLLQFLSYPPNFNWLNCLVNFNREWVLYTYHHRKVQWLGVDLTPADTVERERYQMKVMPSLHDVCNCNLLHKCKTIMISYCSFNLQKIKAIRKSSAPRGQKLPHLLVIAHPHVA